MMHPGLTIVAVVVALSVAAVACVTIYSERMAAVDWHITKGNVFCTGSLGGAARYVRVGAVQEAAE